MADMADPSDIGGYSARQNRNAEAAEPTDNSRGQYPRDQFPHRPAHNAEPTYPVVRPPDYNGHNFGSAHPSMQPHRQQTPRGFVHIDLTEDRAESPTDVIMARRPPAGPSALGSSQHQTDSASSRHGSTSGTTSPHDITPHPPVSTASGPVPTSSAVPYGPAPSSSAVPNGPEPSLSAVPSGPVPTSSAVPRPVCADLDYSHAQCGPPNLWGLDHALISSAVPRRFATLQDLAAAIDISQPRKCAYMNDCTLFQGVPVDRIPWRKSLSHFFGRNKVCTRCVPDHVWIWWCRKHYQRSRYRDAHGYACRLILSLEAQVLRIQAWSNENQRMGVPENGVVVDWTLAVRRRELKRGEREQSETPEPDDDELPGSGSHVPQWLRDMCGPRKTTAEIQEIIVLIRDDILRRNLNQVPDVEFLPRIEGERAKPPPKPKTGDAKAKREMKEAKDEKDTKETKGPLKRALTTDEEDKDEEDDSSPRKRHRFSHGEAWQVPLYRRFQLSSPRANGPHMRSFSDDRGTRWAYQPAPPVPPAFSQGYSSYSSLQQPVNTYNSSNQGVNNRSYYAGNNTAYEQLHDPVTDDIYSAPDRPSMWQQPPGPPQHRATSYSENPYYALPQSGPPPAGTVKHRPSASAPTTLHRIPEGSSSDGLQNYRYGGPQPQATGYYGHYNTPQQQPQQQLTVGAGAPGSSGSFASAAPTFDTRYQPTYEPIPPRPMEYEPPIPPRPMEYEPPIPPRPVESYSRPAERTAPVGFPSPSLGGYGTYASGGQRGPAHGSQDQGPQGHGSQDYGTQGHGAAGPSGGYTSPSDHRR
ncbi:30ffbe05-c2d6-4b98-8772-dc95a2cefa22 [Thermothielavioides terrestris]|uniref:30ffbe05-c2d6-4b98-8772-dc95a2cefa22 n=1 Tax=Thermothielavioides terrestris TaxID=2587410 RepID=A0A3S4D2Y1_9PEZI|nr:30ffbe05-c2d6-4b98-8772-dc95a2cefa22 [Thermothielavioides terrestris]